MSFLIYNYTKIFKKIIIKILFENERILKILFQNYTFNIL